MATPITTFTGHLPGSEPDVKIYTPYRLFLLHSHILRLCSRWFATSMSDVWWKTENCTDGYRYCYDFDYDKDGVSTLIPRSEERNNPSKRKVLRSPQNEETLSGSGDIEDLCTAYEDMFKSFYRLPVPLLDIARSENLISIADQFEALGSVKDTISSCILNWNDLGQQIKQKPIIFINIGYKLESYRIFKDAFIHIVGMQCGQSDTTVLWWEPDLTLPVPVTRIIKSECARLNQIMSNGMRRLLRCKSDGIYYGTSDINDKTTITNCFITYGDHGNEGILSREILKTSLSNTDFSTAVREIFLPLSKNNLSSKIDEPYLTCAQISEDEMPWKKA